MIRLADQPPADRLEYWRTVLCDGFLPLEAVPAGDGDRPIEGTLRIGEVGALRVCEVTGSAQVVQRSPALIRRSDPEYLKVAVVVSGRGILAQGDRQALLAPGDFSAYDSSRPFTLAVDDRFRIVVVMCPKAAVRLSPAELAAATAVRIPGTGGLGGLVSSFLTGLTGALDGEPVLGPVADGYLSDAVVDLLAAGLHAAGTDVSAVGRHARPATLLRAVRGYIEANLARPDLTPEQIAAAHHISTRYLYKLFERDGQSVGEWTRDRRLERCRRDLRDPSLADMAISTIAARWGLVNASHFSRVFRATYGLTPSEYRLATGGLRAAPGGEGATHADQRAV